ncbi:META domain-containing protein [Agromyces albus]|uniref:META domain-containing protein n=2 Tax=Agromyces albus TaxID=205332 RepID=A0A4Q2L9F5_9MICO|nr:META domain-containing protein [Agromyces albus]
METTMRSMTRAYDHDTARTATRSALIGALVLAATALLAGCAGATAGGAPVAEASDAVGAWGNPTGMTTGWVIEPSLNLAADGTLTGSDSCNRLHGSWSDDDGTIAFHDVVSPGMVCSPESPESFDTWLSGLASGTVDGDVLTILDVDGTEIGTLDRASDVDPATVPSGDAEAFFGTWGTADTEGEPSIVISADGTYNGSDGCNFFNGLWWIEADTLDFGFHSLTERGCLPGIDDWLNQHATATVDGDTITFFDRAGSEIGTLTRSE